VSDDSTAPPSPAQNGASAAAGPERPRLRPLEAFPVLEGPEPMLVLRDPSGIAASVSLPPATVAVVQLMDGDSTRDEICRLYEERYRRPMPRARLDQLVEKLDEALLLDSERFRRHSAELHARFRDSEIRAPRLAGLSYPSEIEALRSLLGSYFDPPHGPGAPGARSGACPQLIVAPHVDYQRGGPAYAWAFRQLAEASPETLPEVIVVFGTDHAGADRPFSLTRKHYDTPLGRLTTDVAIVDGLAERVRASVGERAALELFADEHHHRTEHSIELSCVWLRHALGEAADGVTLVPILCGALEPFLEQGKDPSSEPTIAVLLSALMALTQGRRVLWVAAADLAHVGPRYGDDAPLAADDHASLERRDQETLRTLASGSAKAWLDEIWREQNRRRVCGLSPIYHALLCARPRPGRLVAYAQCPADEQPGRATLGHGSVVSIASLVF
jgi:MEMO1 family protein